MVVKMLMSSVFEGKDNNEWVAVQKLVEGVMAEREDGEEKKSRQMRWTMEKKYCEFVDVDGGSERSLRSLRSFSKTRRTQEKARAARRESHEDQKWQVWLGQVVVALCPSIPKRVGMMSGARGILYINFMLQRKNTI